MNNKTQRRIRKYFFSHYFCFVFFRKNNIRGNAATNNTPNEGKKIIEEKSRKSKGYNIKSKGSLTYPSQDVINICKVSEKMFRIFQAIHRIKVNKQKVIIEVLRQFEGGNIFINNNSFHKHCFILVDAVINCYLVLRIKYNCITYSKQDVTIRNNCTKLIHFKGQ
jgi:hypothetical protein